MKICVSICAHACKWLLRPKQNVRSLGMRYIDGYEPSVVGAEKSMQSYALTTIESFLQSYNPLFNLKCLWKVVIELYVFFTNSVYYHSIKIAYLLENLQELGEVTVD